MEQIFGLPAHPLFVHAPIVLLPIAAIGTIVLAARPTWTARGLPWLTGAVAVIVVMVFMARESGEALADVADGRAINGDISNHESLADQTMLISLLWLVALVAAVLVGRTRRMATALSADAAAPSAFTRPSQVLTIVAAVIGAVATVWMIRTGHSGAESHWVGVTRLIDDG